MIEKIPHLPEPKQKLLDHLVEQLSQVSGVCAVVLGGSYASGAHHPKSDMDIGIYYRQAQPFAIADIRQVAHDISIAGEPTVTGFYGWGAWVNGGAWIHTAHGKVDFLYRNLDQIEKTVAEAEQGVFHHDYAQQPTHGFYSMTYLAEMQICIALYDPERRIAGLKRRVEVYPPRLKQTVIADMLWSAEFTLLHARGFAAQGDVYNTVGCLTRAASSLTQALFALNETYYLRDKKVMDTLAGLPNLPPGYTGKIQRILACPGSTEAELTKTVSDLWEAWRQVVSLPGVHYEPRFHM
jgi:hypothetical protein